MDNIKRGQEQVLGDLSMTLCDPYAINFLATWAIKQFQHLINNDGLPRDNTILLLLLRLLALGLSAWTMIDSQDFKEPKLDNLLVTKFLPSLMSLMVDDQVRHLHARLPPDERQSALTVIEHSGPPPDSIEIKIQDSSVAAILIMYYALHASREGARQKDRVGILRVLPILASCSDDRAYENPFLHSLTALLIPMADEFANEDFCTNLFDGYLFAGLSKERDNVNRHLLKLLWYVHGKLPATRLATLMKALQPTVQHHESVHKLYESLQAKIGVTSQEAAAAAAAVPQPDQMMDFDSPLKSVPTPGPHYV